MTNEECVKILRQVKDGDLLTFDKSRRKALDMAIEIMGNFPTQMSGTPDLISRQAAYNALVKHEESDGQHNYSMFRSVVSECEEIILDLPSAQPKQQWIPVNLQNNSPEENKVVLLGVRFRDDFKYFVTSRQDYNYWTGLGREIRGELRWQPLPEPYREGEE